MRHFLVNLQQALENFYRLDPAPAITHFLIFKKTALHEELLILQEEDLYLALVLDPLILVALQHKRRLSTDHFHEFCLAVEGVSHYLFVIFCARQLRQVRAIELEIQGEVDKYIASLMLARRSREFTGNLLYGRLFENFQLAEHLSSDLAERYRYANMLARRYIHSIERKYIMHSRLVDMVEELREFYRLTYTRKQEVIAAG